jgi:nucleotide-binding universal stress UspA family protein
MFKKLLLCVDDSPLADQIGRVGADVARRYDAEIVLLSVLDPARFATPPYSGLEAAGMIDRHSRSLTDTGHRVSVHLTEMGIPNRRLFLPGRAADTILEVADQEGADLIVMGGGPKGRLRSWLEGNLWADVSRAAPCSVLRVGPPEAERTPTRGRRVPAAPAVAPVAAAPRYAVSGVG